MKFTTSRENLLRPLQLVTGVVERRQTLPVLSNLLVKAADGVVYVLGRGGRLRALDWVPVNSAG